MQNKSFGKNILHGIRGRLEKIFRNPYGVVNVNRFTLIRYKHLAPGKIRTHRLFGKEIAFLSSTELLHGFKEIFVDEIYKQELPAKPYIIDCGANIGLSVIYMKHLYPDAEILAFEPDEQNFSLLERNVRSFGFTGVVLKQEAVWVEDTKVSFTSAGSTESKLNLNSVDHTKTVPAIRLADRMNRKIDFLKIDIEGAEFAVLKDIQQNLHLVRRLFLEYHGDFYQNGELNEIFDMLVKAGFRYYIKEAADVYHSPFFRTADKRKLYDIQLNIFCFRDSGAEEINQNN
ncbi:MAG TPA: FkbM family methyltransferase [Puia sp.]|nr:FkbM family methyltransferase [Puia sp.]